MAKKSGKRPTAVTAKTAKPKAKVASKSSPRASVPTKKPAAPAKIAAAPSKTAARRPVVAAAAARTSKPAATKPAAKVAGSIAKPGTRLAKPTLKAPAAPARPISRTTQTLPVGKGPTSAQTSAPARPAKLATPSDKLTDKLTDKPADKATAAKPAKTNGVAAAVAPSPAPIEKIPGRPMLMQGPVTVRPLTKKGTFAPIKPGTTNGQLKPIVKPVKRRPERIEPQFVVVQPPTPSVRTSDKAQKNKAGLVQKELDTFRELLLAKRRELVGDMSSMEREALRENGSDLSNLPVHMADQGTDAYEQEFTLHLVEKDRGLLREINDALAKIQNGTYGICEGTGLPISKPRLEAQPWARYSIEFARQMEKRQMPFRR